MNGWSWLNENAWIAAAMLAIGFGGGALTMAWHIAESRSSRYTYLAVIGLAVLSISFVLVGVSVGDNPVVHDRELIPLIRILWLLAAVLLNGFMVVYWAQRVRWNRGWVGYELSDTGD